MKIIRGITILIIAVVLSGSCRKIEQLSSVPHVEFRSFSVFDTTDILGNIGKAGRLKFYFEDGDGNLGLKEPIGVAQDTTNMFLTLFRKRDGVMEPVSDKNDPLLPYSSYRIPYMERLGQNKILKGTISVTFLYQDYSPTDTVKYNFYIVDRRRNESNVESTSEIVISENQVYSN